MVGGSRPKLGHPAVMCCVPAGAGSGSGFLFDRTPTVFHRQRAIASWAWRLLLGGGAGGEMGRGWVGCWGRGRRTAAAGGLPLGPAGR